MLERLRELNSHLDIKTPSSKEFALYGRIIEGYDFSGIIDYMEEYSEMPEEGNIYKASVAEMENTEVGRLLTRNFYGDMPIEIGYCNGKNSTLNGLEYHKGSEIDIAITDLVLLLGHVKDIKENTYESRKVEAFYIPKGTAVELYGTTLHFAPCKVSDDGFKSIIILPAGTNSPLQGQQEQLEKENKLLYMKNKWLLVHPSREVLINKGAYVGILGENLECKY